MSVARDLRRRARPLALRRALAAALLVASAVITVVTAAVPSSAQTPYDEAEPPPSAPIVPAPEPAPAPSPAPSPAPTPTPEPTPEPAPDVTALPLTPVLLPAPGPFGAAGCAVGEQTVTVQIRDPAAPVANDDPILGIRSGVAAIQQGGSLLLPTGPAGSSREVAVRDARIVTCADVRLITHVRDADGAVREQLPTGALSSVTEVGDAFFVMLGGLLPDSLARLTLRSDPVDLGTYRVGSDGVLLALAPVPAGFPTGEHVLQVDAVRADRSVISVAQLVEIAPVAAPAEPTVPAPAPAPAPDAPPAVPVDAEPRRLTSLLLALALLVAVALTRWYLARRRDDDDDIEHDEQALPSPVAAPPARPAPLAGEPTRLVLLALSATLVALAWTLVGGAALTRPRVESLVALVLLQWVGVRIIAGPVHAANGNGRNGNGANGNGRNGNGANGNGTRLADVLGVAAGLTLGTGLHLALDAFFDALPLLSGEPGPHLTIPVTLVALVVAVVVLGASAALGSRRAARRVHATLVTDRDESDGA